MNRRECLLAALDHRRPDRVPYHVQFTRAMHSRMADYYGDPDFESRIGNFIHVCNTKPDPSETSVGPDLWLDQFGIIWDRSVDKDIGVPANRVVTCDNLPQFRMPDPDDPSRFADFESSRRQHPDLYLVVNHSKALFELSWMLAGMTELMMAMFQNPSFVHNLMDKILDFNLRIIDNVCARDIDAMMFGDDYGTQNSLILDPQMWREFIKPRLRQMYQRVRQHGKHVFIHSCGRVRELLPDLIECGVDVFNPFQPEVMNLKEIKSEFGDRLTFYGGISTQRTLPYGTTHDVTMEVDELLTHLGASGGFIAAPAHAIPGDAKPENVAAMIQALHNAG